MFIEKKRRIISEKFEDYDNEYSMCEIDIEINIRCINYVLKYILK